MSMWLFDYVSLKNEIDYLKFKLTDYSLSEDERKKTELQLQEREQRERAFIQLVSSFKGLEHQILRMKYIESMKLDQIAQKLSLSSSYINKKHAYIIRTLKLIKQLKD